MSWIKQHSDILTHQKLYRLAALLGKNRFEALGYLSGLWHFTALNSWTDGDLGAFIDTIEPMLEWQGQPGMLVLAFQESGLLDDCVVHEWTTHQSDFIRLKQRYGIGKSGESTTKVGLKTTKVVTDKIREDKIREDNKHYLTTYAKPAEKTPDLAVGNIKPEIPVEPAPEPEAGVLAACQKIKNISPAMLASWRSTYPSLDIVREIQKADCWAVANQKTYSRWGRFVNNWLKNAQKGPKDTGHGKDAKNATGGNLDALAVALTECWLENQTGKAPDKATAEATCKLYYNDIKMYLDLWRGDMDGAAAFLAEFAQEKRKQGYNRWPMSWATKAAALKVAEKEAGR
jgi:hypothetical protein